VGGHAPSALAVEDLIIPQGATESGTWPTPWLYAEGDPLDVPAGWPDDWTGRMEIRQDRGDVLLARLHSSEAADGLLTLDTATEDGTDYARITPAIDPAVSAGWAWADEPWVYDVELTDGVRVIRLVEGAVTLSGEVTTDA
jgi:hypothetical protein